MNDNFLTPFLFITRYLKRFNSVIFIVVTTTGLIFCITIISSILIQPYTNDITDRSNTFDPKTISSLGKLQTSDNNTKYQKLPSGRINPFAE